MSATSFISKKRYHEIESRLANEKPNDVEGIMKILREVMIYDPEAKQYTPEKGARLRARIKERAAEQGKSIYEYAFKDYYKRKTPPKVDV
jgi:hypothetical protein